MSGRSVGLRVSASEEERTKEQHIPCFLLFCFFFFFNDTATTEIYTLSLHDALPILSTSACNLAMVAFWAAISVFFSACNREIVACCAAI